MVAVGKLDNGVILLLMPPIKRLMALGDGALANGDGQSNFQVAPADEHKPVPRFVFRNLVDVDRQHPRLHVPSRAAIRRQKLTPVNPLLTAVLAPFEQTKLMNTPTLNPRAVRIGTRTSPPRPAPFVIVP